MDETYHQLAELLEHPASPGNFVQTLYLAERAMDVAGRFLGSWDGTEGSWNHFHNAWFGISEIYFHALYDSYDMGLLDSAQDHCESWPSFQVIPSPLLKQLLDAHLTKDTRYQLCRAVFEMAAERVDRLGADSPDPSIASTAFTSLLSSWEVNPCLAADADGQWLRERYELWSRSVTESIRLSGPGSKQAVVIDLHNTITHLNTKALACWFLGLHENNVALVKESEEATKVLVQFLSDCPRESWPLGEYRSIQSGDSLHAVLSTILSQADLEVNPQGAYLALSFRTRGRWLRRRKVFIVIPPNEVGFYRAAATSEDLASFHQDPVRFLRDNLENLNCSSVVREYRTRLDNVRGVLTNFTAARIASYIGAEIGGKIIAAEVAPETMAAALALHIIKGSVSPEDIQIALLTTTFKSAFVYLYGQWESRTPLKAKNAH